MVLSCRPRFICLSNIGPRYSAPLLHFCSLFSAFGSLNLFAPVVSYWTVIALQRQHRVNYSLSSYKSLWSGRQGGGGGLLFRKPALIRLTNAFSHAATLSEELKLKSNLPEVTSLKADICHRNTRHHVFTFTNKDRSVCKKTTTQTDRQTAGEDE